MRSTITDAFREMRGLLDTNAGRLRGLAVRHLYRDLPLTGTPHPWHDMIHAGITARRAGALTTDSPEYLVVSDDIVVLLLTAGARLVRPDFPLTPVQARHQRRAADVLGDLPRHVLADLADRLADAHGHDITTTHPDGALRVAPADEPTTTCWVSIGADMDAARAAIRDAGINPHHMIIIVAVGYGRYGRERHRLDLDILCAIGQVANIHGVSRYAVGEWLGAEGATGIDVRPADIIDEFGRIYIGAFGSEHDYTQHRMTELGWTPALHAAGIPQDYLDVRAITRDFFNRDVRHINSGTPGRIEVLRRVPHSAPDHPPTQRTRRCT